MPRSRISVGALTATLLATLWLSPQASSQQRIGPSFACDAPAVASQPLAQIICSSDELSSEEMRYIIAYQALRHSLDDGGKQALVKAASELVATTNDVCQLPKTGRVTGSVNIGTIACIKKSFEGARRSIADRLSGDAVLEANLTPEDAQQVQRLLKSRGILPTDATVDGVFGPATRAAITQYQRLAEARLAARAVLAGDRRVPIAGDARLSGVRDEGSCFDNGRVYATVSVSKNSMRKADGLNDALRKSLSRVPSPQAGSYFWQDGQPFPFGDIRGK